MEYCNLDVKSILPQKEPFSFVDCIREFDSQAKKIEVCKTFSDDEYFLKGHFPDNPVIPGVIITEAMSQACVLCGYLSSNRDTASIKKYEHLVFELKVKFHHKALPNETIIMESTLVSVLGPVSVFKVKARNGNGELVANGEIKGVAHTADKITA